MFTIEKNIPIPRPPLEYPFNEMDIGDSFFIQCDSADIQHRRQSVLSASKEKRKKEATDFKLATRKVADGIRVWRIK